MSRGAPLEFIYLVVLGCNTSVPHCFCSCGTGMCNLTSLTGDGTCVPYIGRWVPHHWTTRQVLTTGTCCCLSLPSGNLWASLVVQMVKSPPAVQETWVRSLAWEDPLEEGMATHSSILAWRIPWTEEPGGLQSMGSQKVRHGGASHLILR